MELDQEFISTRSAVVESKVHLKEVKELHETGKHLFVKLSTGDSFIMPNSQVDTELFKQELLRLLSSDQLIIKEELDWKW